MSRILAIISVFILAAAGPAAGGEAAPELPTLFNRLRGNAAEISNYAKALENLESFRKISYRLESEDRVVSSEAHAELLRFGTAALPYCYSLGLLGLDLSAFDAFESEVSTIPTLMGVAEKIIDRIRTPELISALGKLRDTPFDRLVLGILTAREADPKVHLMLAEVFENGSLVHRNRICLKLTPVYARHFVPELIKIASSGEIDDAAFMLGAAARSDLQPLAADLLLQVANANVPALIQGTELNSSYARGRCAAAMKYVVTTHEVIPALTKLLTDTDPGSLGSMGKVIPVGRLAGESLTRLAGTPDPRLEPPKIVPRGTHVKGTELVRLNPLLLTAQASICSDLWKRWYEIYSDVLVYDSAHGRFVVPPVKVREDALEDMQKEERRRKSLELLALDDRILMAKGLLLLNSSAVIEDLDTLKDLAAGSDIELAAIAMEVVWSLAGKENTSIYQDIILNANESFSAAAVRFYLHRIGQLRSESMEQILNIGKVPAKVEVLRLIADNPEYRGLLKRVRDSLTDESQLVRAKACEVLKAIPYPEAKPQLLSLLDDSSPAVRGTAALALASIGSDADVFEEIAKRLGQEGDPIAFFKFVDAMIEIDNAASAIRLVEIRRRPDYARELDDELRLRLEKLAGVDLFDDDIKMVFEGTQEEALRAARYLSKYGGARIKPRVRGMLRTRREPTVRAGVFLAAELRLRNLTPQVWSLIDAAEGRLKPDICRFAEKAGGYDLVTKLMDGMADGSLPRREVLFALDGILGFGWTGDVGQFDVRSTCRRYERWWMENSNSKEPLKPVPDWFKQGCNAKLALFSSTNEELRKNAAYLWQDFFERHTGTRPNIPEGTPQKTVTTLWNEWWAAYRNKLKFSAKRRILVVPPR